MYIRFRQSLAMSFEAINSEFGLDYSLDIPVRNILTHKNPANINLELECEMVSNRQNHYRDDFRFFGFCRSLSGESNCQVTIATEKTFKECSSFHLFGARLRGR